MGELTVEAYRNFSRHKIEENNPGVLIVNWDYSSPVRISYEGHEYRAVCSKRKDQERLTLFILSTGALTNKQNRTFHNVRTMQLKI